jgi:hypothetical protein
MNDTKKNIAEKIFVILAVILFGWLFAIVAIMELEDRIRDRNTKVNYPPTAQVGFRAVKLCEKTRSERTAKKSYKIGEDYPNEPRKVIALK